ncbi:MAG: TfoX/Sxy family protein [Methanobrevibacter sp.]|jgi:DNA transformation protein|nr:TfoX/Sxy family protein [Methanobrevibacter sp.]
MVKKLSDLMNIGKVCEKQLLEVGIKSLEELEEIGSMEAWLRIKEIDPSSCINKLRAIEGAIQGVRWHDLDESTKKSLDEFYKEHKDI